jgi:hypothetical protein
MISHQSNNETYVAALLAQYAAYKHATDEDEKKRIGDKMFFPNPVVWILYKYRAYQGTNHSLNTWEDLITHSMSHDGICKKRLQFLTHAIRACTGIDLLNPEELSRSMPLNAVATHNALDAILKSPSYSEQWNFHEYYCEDGKVAKWKVYTCDEETVVPG